jgi:hypothetical protein
MTEAEWGACREPALMFMLLAQRVRPRKARLFAVVCCRIAWSAFRDQRTRNLIDVTERFADRTASRAEMRVAAKAALAAELEAARHAESQEGLAAWHAASAAAILSGTGEWDAMDAANVSFKLAMVLDRARQAEVIRELFGNPFRPVERAAAWRTEQAVALAHAAYATRDFSAMPLLAEALQHAGCSETSLLAHCREPSPHYRGCWVVDLLLGAS